MSKIIAYLHSKNVIHRDAHEGNWMVADNKLYLLDLGTALYLENGIVEPTHKQYWE